MSHNRGVLAYVRRRVKTKNGFVSTLAYINIILQDPCVYCGDFGCDSVDHIHPRYLKTGLATGFGLHHWTNLAPAHKGCNMHKGSKGLIHELLSETL